MISKVRQFKYTCSSNRILRLLGFFVVTACSLYLLQFLYSHPKILMSPYKSTFHAETERKFSTEEIPRNETQVKSQDNKLIIVKETIKALNNLGQAPNPLKSLLEVLGKKLKKIDEAVLYNAIEVLEKLADNPNKINLRNLLSPVHKTNITVGVLVCGDRREQALIMLKSTVMFSLDANLHVVVVSDLDTILGVGQDLLSMKLGLDEIGYFGFTFELVLEWYPHDTNGPDWKNMYQKCATQRLFLPNMLPHHDAMIYLDTDILVISNLTEIWDIFRNQMRNEKMLGVTPNSEAPGIYTTFTDLPAYGENGINAGFMLLNLTQMRQFDFEARAKAIHTTFKELIILADQDIINVMAHGFPGKILDITCAHNFYWIHCIHPNINCYGTEGIVNSCFCDATIEMGIRILHGNSGTFTAYAEQHPFVQSTFTAFRDLDFYSDSYLAMFTSLLEKFNEIKPSPCSPLTADILYGNAIAFLESFNFQ